MLTRAEIKYLNSLQNKKYRKIEHAFLVEGLKNVTELLLSDYEIIRLFCSESSEVALKSLAQKRKVECEIVPEKLLLELGTLKNNQTALAVARLRDLPNGVDLSHSSKLILALDGINDPGNLGTIIRTADWFGVTDIVCSHDTVDVYNPKVINSTKGSFTRVRTSYEELDSFFLRHSSLAVYAACLEGEPVDTTQLTHPAILLMGNEANGIRPALLKLAEHKISIAKIGQAESLNVGVATGILLNSLIGRK